MATTDWAGISVALANNQVDLAWMGPWGYVLANDDSGAQAIATAKYDGKPIYYAIVVCRPGSREVVARRSEGQARVVRRRGLHVGLVGATHAANEISVASGQVDCATDFDRNRNAMIESGKLERNATEVVWQSDPLPNDANRRSEGLRSGPG